MSRIYMDHNATTPVHPAVLEAMWPLYAEEWGNPSSIHWAGREPAGRIDDARDQVAAFINAPSRDIVFTSGGTEADNTALMGVLMARQDRGRHIVTSSIEHKAIIDMGTYLTERHGAEVTALPVDSAGRHDLDAFADSLRDDTVLASVMLANNELGNLNPIKEMAALAHERGVSFHCDAVNGLGKTPIDVKDLGVDLMSISAHKIYGPKGCGALYIKRKTPFEAYIRGGGQERGRRCGTYNAAGIVGFGTAAALASKAMEEGLLDRLARLRDRLEAELRERLDDVEVNGDVAHRLPNTSNVSFAGVDGEALVLNLDLRGIAISTGSACTSGSLDPSHVLVALNKDPRWLDAAIRFSLGASNDESQVDVVIEAVVEEVQKLRRLAATG